jgi:hypothetical protein
VKLIKHSSLPSVKADPDTDPDPEKKATNVEFHGAGSKLNIQYSISPAGRKSIFPVMTCP